MKIASTSFETSAADLDGCPSWDLPEFAVIGRSNVGKSSLLNMLTNRRDLAKVSATPGATRLINFFKINQRWALVDLPGYGFSKTGQAQRRQFQEAVTAYLTGRPNLRRVLVLIDSRLTPQKIDLEFCQWLADTGVPFVLVFTKTDKLSAKKVDANVDGFLNAFAEVFDGVPQVFRSSAKSGGGRGEILGFIGSMVAG
jgi:GTP-binding protein